MVRGAPPSVVSLGPFSAGVAVRVGNFINEISRPSRPTRHCRKRIGLPEVIAMANPITKNTGDNRSKPTVAAIVSTQRFLRDRHQRDPRSGYTAIRMLVPPQSPLSLYITIPLIPFLFFPTQ